MTNGSRQVIPDARARFEELHQRGIFMMLNPWDVGSARLLVSLGFPALATTSSGLAASMGRMDQQVSLDELVDHVGALVEAVDVPISVDAENCFALTPSGAAENVERVAGTGAAGISIEDFHPEDGLYAREEAADRVRAAAEAAHSHQMVLTARAENHLYGVDDLPDTIARLVAYRKAGADVLYAPGLEAAGAIGQLVDAVGGPVNVLLRRRGPSVRELRELGVRRVSTGGSLAFAAYGAAVSAARELLGHGTSSYIDHVLAMADREAAFAPGRRPPDG